MKKHLLKTMVAVLAIAAAAAGPVRGQNASPDVTLDFTTNSWGLPSGSSNKTYAANSYTSGDYTITLQGGGSSSNGYYFHSDGYLFLGKTGAYLQLPAFSSAVDSIQVVGTSGASTTVTQNVYVDENNSWVAVSTQTTGMKDATQTYVINENYRAAGNIYFIKVDNSYNTQITYIKVYYTTAASGGSQPITCTLEDVGKVLCSDGSIYATASAASADSKTAVAMITYLDVTTHKGLAMSLTDVNAGTSFCSQTSVTCQANLYGNEAAAKGDMDGLANTAALVAHATHTHGAANVAANYNVARPEGASAWFLPSAGQWDRMVTAAGGYESLQSMLSLASDLYWSSSERNRFNAWAISFNSQELGNYTKTETHRVRACFEFDANILVPHTVRFAAGNDGWMVTDVDSARSATAPAILNGVMAGDSLVVTAPASLNRKVKSVKAVKYVPPVLVESIELNLQSTSLGVDSTMTLTASVLPANATNKSVTWSSSNTGVASVDQNGVVTGVASGTANIIATANDGSGVADTCTVSVMNSVTIDGVQLNYVAGDNWQAVVTRNSTVLSIGDNNKVRLTEGNVYLDFNGQSVDGVSSFNPANASNYHWLRHFNVWIASRDIYYFQGETWATAIQNHSQNSSLDWSTNSTYVIYDNLQYLTDENNNGAPVNPNSVINPSGSYSTVSLDD